MLLLSTLIRYSARRVKVNMPQTEQKPNEATTKFTQDEILEMAGYK